MNSLSTDAVLKELANIAKNTTDITEFLDEANIILYSLNEEQYDKVTRHLRLGILDIERFVKVNNCQVITNPRAFAKNNIPSDDGLLSNKIFGITREETAGIFAYIDLHGWFIDPSCYKSWIKVDKNIKNIVHGIDTYIINEKGEFVQDPSGKTGIEFLRKNINKIKFKTNESLRRDINVRYLEANRDKMFIQKYLVIPKFYRDKNTSDSASRTVGLSGINKLYNDLIVASNALTATQDYMFDATDSMNGRVQEIILNIYNWFTGASSKSADANTRGIQGKFGILRRANMSKTANYSSRLVISAPELKVENPGDMKVDLEHSAIPLAACMADFRDFIIYHTRKFFDNEFQGLQTRPLYDPETGEITNYEVESPQIYFSDDRIIKEMERYLHGYNNRFVPIEVPVKNYDKKVYMMFKGRYGDVPSTNPEAIYQRRLTWCDVFFIAASEAVKGKHSLITRFPINFVTKITRSVALTRNSYRITLLIAGNFLES